MKVAVVGLWHLGTVTAACIATQQHQVVAYDSEHQLIENLNQGSLPVDEPGLQVLLQEKRSAGFLQFTSTLSDIAGADVVWVTYDTPVDESDQADTEFVIQKVEALFPYLKSGVVLLISSQLPVGSTQYLQGQYQRHYSQTISFAYSPENLRLGQAIHGFMEPERVIIGVEDEAAKSLLTTLFSPVTASIVWMKISSSEMTKHAINAFLATSIVFANELATLCEQVGADASEVEKGLRTEPRIGPRAYLKPGNAFAGGTLARDLQFLVKLSQTYHFETQLFPAVIRSNTAHKQWVCRKMAQVLGKLAGKRLCVLGLTYKSETDTLRCSVAMEICAWLHEQGAHIVAYDPMLKTLPKEYVHIIDLKSSMTGLFNDLDAVVLTKLHQEFQSITPITFSEHKKPLYIFDENGFLKEAFHQQDAHQYFCLGGSV